MSPYYFSSGSTWPQPGHGSWNTNISKSASFSQVREVLFMWILSILHCFSHSLFWSSTTEFCENCLFFNRKKAVRRKAKTKDLTIEVDEREPTTLVIRGRQVTIYFWFLITLLIAISYILCWPGWTRVSQVQATHRLGGSSTNTGISSHNHNQTTNRHYATSDLPQRWILNFHNDCLISGDCYLLWSVSCTG